MVKDPYVSGDRVRAEAAIAAESLLAELVGEMNGYRS
jgi:hypothetical protein